MMIDFNNKVLEAGEVDPALIGSPENCPDGIYETMLVVGGLIVAQDAHLERFYSSVSQLLDLKLPKVDVVKNRIYRLLSMSEPTGLEKVRLLAYADPETGKANLVISLHTVDEEKLVKVREAGIELHPVQTRKAGDNLFNFKRSGNAIAIESEKDDGGSLSPINVLILNDVGFICEAGYSNIFLVKGKKLHTPPISSPCLPGITRSWVIENAGKAELIVEEKDLRLEDFAAAEEVFCTSSVSGIVPVRKIETCKEFSTEPLPVTRQVQAYFQEFIYEV